MDKAAIDRANRVLRAVEWGARSHAAGLWLIQKAQTRHAAQGLRQAVAEKRLRYSV